MLICNYYQINKNDRNKNKIQKRENEMKIDYEFLPTNNENLIAIDELINNL